DDGRAGAGASARPCCPPRCGGREAGRRHRQEEMNAGPNLRDQLLAAIPSLRAFAVSLGGTRGWADDLVQETLTKAWANLHGFRPGTNLTAWLFTILRNEFYSQLRKRRREVEDADETYASQLAVAPHQ